MTFRTLAGLALAAALLPSCSASGSLSATSSTSPGTSASASTSASAAPTTAPSTAGSASATPTTMPSGMVMPSSTPGAATSTNAVSISGFAYAPNNATVKVGDSITFTNKDSAAHTVTPDTAGAFPDSGNLPQNASKTITFTTAGTFPYHCQYHPGMHGTITVQ